MQHDHHSNRQAVWDDGVRACAICPGWVNTDMAETPLCTLSPEEMTQPIDVARLIKTALELPNTASMAELTVNSMCDAHF